MPGLTKRKVFRILLTTFKWCRIAVWLVILAIVSAILYLHLAGLPDYVKTRLLAELHQRGIDAQFSEMKMGWAHEIIIQGITITIGRANDPLRPSLSAGSAEVRVDFMALLNQQLKIDSFRLDQGQMRVPAGGPDGKALSLEEVGLRLRFLPGDCVRLENAHGTLHGVAIFTEGVVTNFSAMQDWKFPAPTPKKPAANQETESDWHASLRQALAVADMVRFSKPPELHMTVSGDARDPNSFVSALRLAAPDAQTPWGELTNFIFKADCSHVITPGDQAFATVQVSADRVRTTWGGASQINLRMALSRNEDPVFMHGSVDFSAARLHGMWADSPDGWARMGHLDWTGAVDINLTNLAVKAAQGTLRIRQADSALGSIRQAAIAFQSSTNSKPALTNAAWGPWDVLAPYNIDWQIESTGIKTPAAEIQSLNSVGTWRGPDLAVQKFDAALYNNLVKAEGRLDVSTRRLQATLSSDVKLNSLEPLLSQALRDHLAEFVAQSPPKFDGRVSLVLPPWTNRETNWQAAVLRSMEGAANISIDKCAFRNIAADSLRSSLTYSNGSINLPRFELRRPDGTVFLHGTANGGTGDFQFAIDTQLDPKALIKQLVDLGDQESWLNETQLAHPPKIHAEGRGNWHHLSRLAAHGNIEITNFVALSQPFGSFTASLDYSNLVLNASNVSIIQGDQFISVPLLKYDFAHDIMTFVNGTSTFDPRRVFKSLGTILPEFLHQIAFDSVPSVKCSGWFSMDDAEAVDLQFHVAGEKFRWTNEINLRVDWIAGDVDWRGREVNLTNVHASLYGGGSGGGWAYFDWRKLKGTLTTFETTVTNVDLNALVHGLSGDQTRVEGKLDGKTTIRGNCRYSNSWHGYGQLQVHDAMLWDIPLFGIFSPLLNNLGEGWGNNRAREADGTFVLTNGVVRTQDMTIRTSKGINLLYRGDADMRDVNARVEVRILSNFGMVGRMLSTLLSPVSKTLEWRVTGTLRNPVAKPAYAPGYILDTTLHPIRALKSLIIPGAGGQSPAPIDPTETGAFEQNFTQ